LFLSRRHTAPRETDPLSLHDALPISGRIRAWATGGVLNASDIMVSFRPGYFYGNGSFNYLVTLAGTHGGLERSATLGFAMATFPDRKSTRLNSSHSQISYAVFCLKKK